MHREKHSPRPRPGAADFQNTGGSVPPLLQTAVKGCFDPSLPDSQRSQRTSGFRPSLSMAPDACIAAANVSRWHISTQYTAKQPIISTMADPDGRSRRLLGHPRLSVHGVLNDRRKCRQPACLNTRRRETDHACSIVKSCTRIIVKSSSGNNSSLWFPSVMCTVNDPSTSAAPVKSRRALMNIQPGWDGCSSTQTSEHSGL